MTHLFSVETVALLQDYFLGPERRLVYREVRGRRRSRKIHRATRFAMGQLQHRGKSTGIGQADFSDPESQRVFDAAAGAVARELGRQAGREWFDLMARKEPE